MNEIVKTKQNLTWEMK